MSVTDELGEIERTVKEELGPSRAHEEKRTARSRWNVYEKTLRAVERTAGTPAMRTLASWIKTRIREGGRMPTGREVREKGGQICRDNGYEIEPDSWLHP